MRYGKVRLTEDYVEKQVTIVLKYSSCACTISMNIMVYYYIIIIIIIIIIIETSSTVPCRNFFFFLNCFRKPTEN